VIKSKKSKNEKKPLLLPKIKLVDIPQKTNSTILSNLNKQVPSYQHYKQKGKMPTLFSIFLFFESEEICFLGKKSV
jgi:hypothetical protein